ncbi:hypothetical protein [Streptomyces sp. AVP053U2]|uniref:hypothetical protein n=1 Tax=Streptomyces sp. AVP053U2 TaxID=1737066 RepID=UPI00073BF9ED|nr:hypothetical protein [Streptomyces sp. AVP053U2]ODA69531.1 hypothetical protein APS67_006335 [Streptomyces sp. AVP053U2]
MPHVYRCRQCRAASPPTTRKAAEEYRQAHRDVEHGGLVPAGEEIVRVPGSTRDSDSRYVSTGALLGGLALLALASAVARALGR